VSTILIVFLWNTPLNLKKRQLELVTGGGGILGRVEKSIEIKAPPEKVWEMLALDRLPEWMKELKSVKYTSEVSTHEDKYRVGATAHITEQHEEFDVEATENLKNEKITYHSKGPLSRSGNVTLVLTYTLEPVEAGTKLTFVDNYEMPWGILGKVLEKLFVQRMGEKEVERSLETLKSILEK